jgi:excisionase family DNA binding protein
VKSLASKPFMVIASPLSSVYGKSRISVVDRGRGSAYRYTAVVVNMQEEDHDMRTASRIGSVDPVVDDGFASIEEGCKYLRVCRATLYGLMESGAVSYAKFGKSRRIPWRALKDYAARSLVAR